jgi:cytochrome c oxidase subunit IV
MTHVQGYVAVFGALLSLTLVTVGMSYLHLPSGPTIVLGLAIASTKAALVVLFFMHLKNEKPMVFWPLALTMFLFIALFAFVLWSEADHIVLKSTSTTPNFQLPTPQSPTTNRQPITTN